MVTATATATAHFPSFFLLLLLLLLLLPPPRCILDIIWLSLPALFFFLIVTIFTWPSPALTTIALAGLTSDTFSAIGPG